MLLRGDLDKSPTRPAVLGPSLYAGALGALFGPVHGAHLVPLAAGADQCHRLAVVPTQHWLSEPEPAAAGDTS